MSRNRFDTAFAAAICVIIAIAVFTGFASRYVAGQANLLLAQTVDSALDAPSRRSSWTMLRDGYVLGRAESKRGDASYIVVARRPGGEYRVVVSVDKDGSILDTASLGASNGFMYARRLKVLFDRTGGGGINGDVTPIDVALQPMVVNAIETITRLERQRMDERHE